MCPQRPRPAPEGIRRYGRGDILGSQLRTVILPSTEGRSPGDVVQLGPRSGAWDALTLVRIQASPPIWMSGRTRLNASALRAEAGRHAGSNPASSALFSKHTYTISALYVLLGLTQQLSLTPGMVLRGVLETGIHTATKLLQTLNLIRKKVS